MSKEDKLLKIFFLAISKPFATTLIFPLQIETSACALPVVTGNAPMVTTSTAQRSQQAEQLVPTLSKQHALSLFKGQEELCLIGVNANISANETEYSTAATVTEVM